MTKLHGVVRCVGRRIRGARRGRFVDSNGFAEDLKAGYAREDLALRDR